MNIEFRHGPKDGERKFLPLGRASETIIVTDHAGIDYLYKLTTRYTDDGCYIYQCLGIVSELIGCAA